MSAPLDPNDPNLRLHFLQKWGPHASWDAIRLDLTVVENRAVEVATSTLDMRFRKFERAVRHDLFRNHDHNPECEGCVEFAAFIGIPGYQGADQPLVDGH